MVAHTLFGLTNKAIADRIIMENKQTNTRMPKQFSRLFQAVTISVHLTPTKSD